jgi:PAS domain S-box-containing protein
LSDKNISIEQQLKELQRINSYMKLIIDSTRSIFMLLDLEANVLYCSDYILGLLGIEDINEIVGKPVKDIRGIYDDKAYFNRSVERYNRLLAGEDNFTEDDEIIWPRAGKRLYQISHNLVQSKEGDFKGICLILRDVTDERIEEESQRMKERLLATQMPSFVWDEKGNTIDCNKEALSLLGLPENLPQESYNKEILALQPKYQTNGRITENIRQQFVNDTLRKGYSHVEIVLEKADGTPLPVDAMGVRISWRYENRMFVYFHDLTEIKTKEAEAKEAEERVRIMLDSTPLICILRNENYEVIDCNREALNIFGISESGKEDFIKRSHEFYPEFQPDGERSVEKIQKHIQHLHEKSTEEFELTILAANGELIPVMSKFVSISWKGVLRFLSYSRDLREEKANEQKMLESIVQTRRLELQKEKAKASSEAKSQFLASMSHEIRTPMNTIIGLLELMNTDNFSTVQKNYIKDIKHVSTVLLQIINDILDFHKIESGKLELLYTHFDLKMLYNDLVTRNRFLAESKNLKFKSSFAQELPHTLYGDELRIGQIITNLLSNAIKYTRRGYVSLSVDKIKEYDKEFIVFSVEDSGIGIKEENFSSMFVEFEQFDSRKNRGVTGTGLGLSIVKRLTEMMKGDIRFVSEYGKGSVFTLSLPLIMGDREKIERKSEIANVIAKPDTKVLVADDNAGNITVIIGLLARHGIVPQTAINGIEAVEMVKTNEYDLVFMDHMMAEMDGVEATRIIRSLDGEYYSNLPIIALSANAVTGAKNLFFSSGMNDFVMKPIDIHDLNRALLRWLPKDKIAEQESETGNLESPEDDTISDKLLEELIKIKDLKITDGLSHVGGDKKLYIDVLLQFCNSAENEISSLKKYAKNGLWRDYAIRIHGLKSVFANIGNQFMSDWAFSLEEAAVRGNINKCLNETHNFCNTLKQFHTRLLQTDIVNYYVSKSHKMQISNIDLVNKLEQLLLACNDFQAEVAEPIAKELLEVTFNKKVDETLVKLCDSVFSFDYNETAEIVDELMQYLQSSKTQ